jgi:hypothetical protein
MVLQIFCSTNTNRQVDDLSLGWSEQKWKQNYFGTGGAVCKGATPSVEQ